MKSRCVRCDGSGIEDQVYLSMSVMPDLLEQTPKSVWADYLANGYTLHQAVAEELSYGDVI
jgi:hypothetical protein